MLLLITVIVLLFRVFQSSVNSECIISTNRDLNELQPLLLRPGSWPAYGNYPYYLPGNREGEIKFDADQDIILHCPGSQIQAGDDVIASGILAISCDSRRSFRAHPSGRVLPFSAIKCTQPVRHMVRRTTEKCNQNNDVLEVGFPLNDGRFITQITVCFDPLRKRTFYTKFHMTHAIAGLQMDVARSHFQEGGSFFNLGVPVEQCYYTPAQRRTINTQLNRPAESVEFIDRGTTIFTRGHLAAKGDFVYGPQQGATFYWVNAAPQWAPLNNDNWNELEKSLREYASVSQRDFIVYTGTHGLASVNNVDLFLHCDDVNHIPVPQYFWKVVYDEDLQAGVAFVGMNNPFDQEDVPFCASVCDLLQWQITWERHRRQLGFSFCCDVNEFRRFVQFPEFPVTALLKGRY